MFHLKEIKAIQEDTWNESFKIDPVNLITFARVVELKFKGR